jgi:N utilization substance protein A
MSSTLTPFEAAIQQICAEKGIAPSAVTEAVEAAIAAAYRRDYAESEQVIRAELTGAGTDPHNFKVFRVWHVLTSEEEMSEPERELTLADALAKDPEAIEGGEVVEQLPLHIDFGRIAAMTAKQVIVQKLREAERTVLFDEFKDKESKLLNGSVQQVDRDTVYVSLGKVTGIMPPREQIKGEFYAPGQRIRVFVKEVGEGARGPQIIVTRGDARFVEALFNLEVPEIPAGTVEIKAISREGGSRTKMAVWATTPGVDPVGSCVGQRGTRVQAVLNEIGAEKVDIILWDEDTETFIRNALSPARVREVMIDEAAKVAKIHVDADQLSLAIGRGGQNVRLASKLTGYTLDIVRDEEAAGTAEEVSVPEEV